MSTHLNSPTSTMPSQARAAGRFRRGLDRAMKRSLIAGLIGLVLLVALFSIGRAVDGHHERTLEKQATAHYGIPVDIPDDIDPAWTGGDYVSPRGVVLNYLNDDKVRWFGALGFSGNVADVTVEGDDVIITLNETAQQMSIGSQIAAMSHQDDVLRVLRGHLGNKTVAAIDLVAVRSADGVLLGYEKL